jgi:bisphosphoglycerate-dependent phosphoglycerate mutase
MHPIKDIYLIRHGETDYNRLGVVQGSGIDADLNDLGRRQAQAFLITTTISLSIKYTLPHFAERISQSKDSLTKAFLGNSTKV